MLPFSVTRSQSAPADHWQMTDSGYELIAFNVDKLNVFAAEVHYCEPHWHSAPELLTVLKGEFTVIIGQKKIALTQGDMLYINAEEVHSLSAKEAGCQLVTVQFSPGLFDELHPSPTLSWCAQNATRSTADYAVYLRLQALLEQLIVNRAPFQRIAATYLLIDALVSAGKPMLRAESSLREEALIKKGINFINQHFDQTLTLSEVARQCNVSYSWFSRVFKRVSRHNFKEYVTLMRLNKAQTLLRDTQAPITEISHRCGFQEHKYLIAAFNKYCGVTPTEYRKRFISRQNRFNSQLAPGEGYLCLPLNRILLDRLAETGVMLPSATTSS